MSPMQHRDFQPSDMTILSVDISDPRMDCLQRGGKGRKSFKTFLARADLLYLPIVEVQIINKLVLSSTMKLTEAKILDGVL